MKVLIVRNFKLYKDFITVLLAVVMIYACAFNLSASSGKNYIFLSPPTATAATSATTSDFIANWTTVAGAASYNIDVSTNPSFSSFVGIYNDMTVIAPTTSVTVSGLVPGQTYYYRVRSFDGITQSINSNTISIATITDPPTANAATSITATSFRANWDIANGATSYKLEVATDMGFGSIILTQSVAGTTFNVTAGLSSGVTYYYRVFAITSGGESIDSNTITVETIPPPPTAIAASSVNTTSFIANWNVVSGATEYRLDLSLYPSFSSFLTGHIDESAATNNLLIPGLVEGQTYYYRVRALTAGGASINSNTISATTLPLTPVASAASSINGTSFTANWSNVSGATEYRLDVADNVGFSPLLAGYSNKQVLSISQLVSGLSSTQTYYYRVRAVSAGGATINSNVIIVPGSPIASSASGATTTSFSANWSTVTDATEHRLDVATDAGFASILPAYSNLLVAGGTQSVTGLSAGQIYYYRVRAVSNGGTSTNSNSINITTVPLAPVATAATSIISDEFTANWNIASGAANYRLDVATDAGFTLLVQNDVAVAGTSRVVSGLTAGQTYYFRVRAESTGGASLNSNIISLITIPGVPVASASTASTTTQFTANWNAVSGATDYLLDVSTSAAFGSFLPGYNNLATTGTTQVVSSLTAGFTYYYRVRARNVGGNSAYSNIITAVTVPPAPVTTSASLITETDFKANWNTTSGASSYLLDVAEDVAFTIILPAYSSLPVASTSQLVSGLNPGTNYYYRVRAVNGSGTGINSNITSLVTIALAPIATSPTSVSGSGFTTNWSAAAGATSYQLDVSLNAGFSPNLPGYNSLSVTGVSYAVTGLGAGQTYYYRVRAVNSGGVSSNSNDISTITLPAAPVATSASLVTASSFTANWNSVSSATEYRIDVATDLGFSSIIPAYNDVSVLATSYSVTSLSAGVTYYYRVRALNGSGIGANSNTISVVTVPPAPTANAATSATSTSFIANWATTSGATDYRLDVSIDPAFGSFVGVYNGFVVSGISSSVTSLSAGTTYYYRVRAVNSNGISGNSNVINIITVPNPTVAVASTGNTGTSFTANWNSIAAAIDYRLDVSTNSSFSSFVSGYNDQIVSGLSQNVSGLSSGQTYYYRVRSANISGSSANSNTIIVPGAPVATTASAISTTSFTANWGAITGATGYKLDVASDAAFASILGSYNNLSVAGTSAVVSGLTAGTTYYYQVRAQSSGGASANSNIITVSTVPLAPTAIAATGFLSNGFTANWNAVTGATGYKLDVATNNTFASIVAPYNNFDVTATNQNVTGLLPGITYYYRVRAYTSGGSGSNSNTISTITVPAAPSANAFSSLTPSSFRANWSTVTGASNYRLDVSTVSDFSTKLAGYDSLSVSALFKVITGITPSTQSYYYRVRAQNAGGISPFSNVILMPRAPVLKKSSLNTSTSFIANWNTVSGVTGYLLDVVTSPDFSPVTGYSALSVASDSQQVSGLVQGQAYGYRVRAVSSGANGPVSGYLIVPGKPKVTGATAITTTSFTARWNGTGAVSYLVDVSNDPAFGSFITIYKDYSTTGNTLIVNNGILPGTMYYYRVRSVDTGGSSANADTSLITLCDAPIATAATNNSTSSFQANWSSVQGATSYRLDVSTSATFASFLAGYNDHPVPGTSATINGLSIGQTYYYRVRAINASGLSAYSNVISSRTGSVIVTAPSLTGICTNADFANMGDIVIQEGSNDVFKYNTDSVTFVLSMPTGFELLPNSGVATKIQGSDLSPGLKIAVSPSTITVKYLINSTSGIEDAFKISGLKIKATGSGTNGTILRTGGTAEQAGNYVPDALVHGNLSSFTTTQANIVGLSTDFCINSNPVTLTGSPAGAGGVFSGRGVSGNTFYPSIAGAGRDTIYYTYTNSNGCTYIYSQILFVNTLTSIDFPLADSVCNLVGESFPLTGLPGGGSFSSSGAGVTGSQATGYTFYPAIAGNGSHSITYTYQDGNNCIQTKTKTLVINPVPVADFTLSDFCDGKTINFIDNSIVGSGYIKSWKWDFGDNDTSTIQNPSHIYLFDGKFIVSLTVKTSTGCSATKKIEVFIGKTPSPVFAWENSCLGDATKFTDITGIDGVITSRKWDFGDGFTSTALSPTHVFSIPGIFKVKLTITTNSNCTQTNSIDVPVFPYISTFPYAQDFELSNGGWISGGKSSSWTLGEPKGTIINKAYSGTKSWITGVVGTYNNNENSYVESPCFNLMGLNKPMISFKLWMDTDKGSDGAILQATVDNGKTWQVVGTLYEGIGWYDSSPIIGAPGGQQIMGWSGRDLKVKWREAKFDLDKYKSASSLRFRIAFGSSSENPVNSNFEGIAFDNIWIGERNHTVLVEHFTNTDKGPEISNFIANLANKSNIELLDLYYHTGFPTVDSINSLNPWDPSSRALFYGVAEVPSTILDGSYKTSKFSTADTIKYRSNILKESKFDIDVKIDTTEVSLLNIRVKITATDTLSSPIIVHTAIVERLSGGINRKRILRKMLPDAAGTSYSKFWNKGDITTFNLKWVSNDLLFKNSEVGVILFIQDERTKEIYQAVYQSSNYIINEITGIQKDINRNVLINLFPNPASDNVEIHLTQRIGEDCIVELYDELGKQVSTGKIPKGNKEALIDLKRLAAGVYTVQVIGEKNFRAVSRLVISR